MIKLIKGQNIKRRIKKRQKSRLIKWFFWAKQYKRGERQLFPWTERTKND